MKKLFVKKNIDLLIKQSKVSSDFKLSNEQIISLENLIEICNALDISADTLLFTDMSI